MLFLLAKRDRGGPQRLLHQASSYMTKNCIDNNAGLHPTASMAPTLLTGFLRRLLRTIWKRGKKKKKSNKKIDGE